MEVACRGTSLEVHFTARRVVKMPSRKYLHRQMEVVGGDGCEVSYQWIVCTIVNSIAITVQRCTSMALPASMRGERR